MANTVLERAFQAELTAELRERFEGCYVLKGNSARQQGIPDWLILYDNKWAALEVKRKRPTSRSDFQPNQEYFINEMDKMSFAAFIYPENKDDILRELDIFFHTRRR